MTKEFEARHAVAHGSAQAVQRGDDDHINPSRLHLGHQPVESRPALLQARDTLVYVLGQGLPAPRSAILTEVKKLSLAALVADAGVEGNASVDCDPLHRASPGQGID